MSLPLSAFFFCMVLSLSLERTFAQAVTPDDGLVGVIVSGASKQPRALRINPLAGTRGALRLTEGATDYGWLPRTKLFRKGATKRIFIPKPEDPDIELQDGDVLEIPYRHLYEDYAPYRSFILPTPQAGIKFGKGFFSEPGDWRDNWRIGHPGREFRLIENGKLHITFISTSPVVRKVLLEPLFKMGHTGKKFLYLSFEDRRPSGRKSIYTEREARLLSKLASITAVYEITDFGLKLYVPTVETRQPKPGEQGEDTNAEDAPE